MEPAADALFSDLVFVEEFLRARGVRVWVDSGSLLGLVRDGRLIGWDSDVDLGVHAEDAPALRRAASELRPRGFRVSEKRFDGTFSAVTIERPGSRPLSVHVYFRQGSFAWAPQVVIERLPARTVAEPERNRGVVTRAYALAKSALDAQGWGGKILGLPFRALKAWKDGLDEGTKTRLWPLSRVYKAYTWEIPATYFAELATLPVQGRSLPVPSNAEAYLAARYGEDWRRPNREWVYWRDDRCLRPLPPREWLRGSGKGDRSRP